MRESSGVRHGRKVRAPSSHAAAGISREDIAGAALDLVRQSGVDGLSMRAVAAQLGVRAPSLYHHVESKGQLLDLVARRAFESLATDTHAYEAVVDLDGWLALVRADSLAVLEFYRAHPGLAAAILQEGDPHREAPGRRQAEVEALLRLGVPRRVAREVSDAAARWTVAAVAGDGSPHSSRRRENRLFRDGLDLLLAGMDMRLRAALDD